jgi:hypothetical protein
MLRQFNLRTYKLSDECRNTRNGHLRSEEASTRMKFGGLIRIVLDFVMNISLAEISLLLRFNDRHNSSIEYNSSSTLEPVPRSVREYQCRS